jgi:hypothetical protein
MSPCDLDLHPGNLGELNRFARGFQMSKLTFTALTVFAAVLVAFASTAAAHSSKGGNGVVKSGTCSASSTSKLKAKADDGRTETEFEVDQNRSGQRWRVTISKNGTTVFRGTRTTQAPSGSFSVHRLLAGGAGGHIAATATALGSGETCRASISF